MRTKTLILTVAALLFTHLIASPAQAFSQKNPISSQPIKVATSSGTASLFAKSRQGNSHTKTTNTATAIRQKKPKIKQLNLFKTFGTGNVARVTGVLYGGESRYKVVAQERSKKGWVNRGSGNYRSGKKFSLSVKTPSKSTKQKYRLLIQANGKPVTKTWTAKRAPKVKLSKLSPFKTYVSGGTSTVSGSVINAKKSYTVQVQELKGKKWKSLKKQKIKSGKKFSLKIKTNSKSKKTKYRVVASSSGQTTSKAWTAKRVQKLAFGGLSTFSGHLPGETKTITGSVKNTAKTYTAELQQSTGGKWKKIKQVKYKAGKKFNFKVKTGNTKTLKYRLVIKSGEQTLNKAWSSKRGGIGLSVVSGGNYFTWKKPVTITTKTTGLVPKTQVQLQRKVDNKWVAVKNYTVTKVGQSFSHSMKISTGDTAVFRAVTTGAPAAGAVTSKTKKLLLTEICRTVLPSPDAGVTLWSSSPTGAGSNMSQKIIDAICASARSAEIYVSMFIVKPNGQISGDIVLALEEQARLKNVKVNFLLEKDRTTQQDLADYDALKRWANVTVCENGCTSFSKTNTGAINHQKNLFISDTIWGSGTDPFALVSTGNFNPWEFRNYYQVGTVVYKNKGVYDAGVADFKRLRKCAKGKSSCSDTALNLSTVLSNVYGYGATKTSQSVGAPLLDIAPKAVNTDTQLSILQNMTCAPGGKIRFMQYSLSSTRLKGLEKELKRLKNEGCAIDFLVNNDGGYKPSIHGLARAQKLGSLRCVTGLHLKSFSAHGVTYFGHRDSVVWYSGSSNLTMAALDRSNESNVLVGYSRTSSSNDERKRAERLADQSEAVWKNVSNARTLSCGL